MGTLKNNLLLDTKIQEKVKLLQEIDPKDYSKGIKEKLWRLLDKFLPSQSRDIRDIKNSFLENPLLFLANNEFSEAKRQELLGVLTALGDEVCGVFEGEIRKESGMAAEFDTIMKRENKPENESKSSSEIIEEHVNTLKYNNIVSISGSVIKFSLPFVKYDIRLVVGKTREIRGALGKSLDTYKKLVSSLQKYLDCSEEEVLKIVGSLMTSEEKRFVIGVNIGVYTIIDYSNPHTPEIKKVSADTVPDYGIEIIEIG